MSAPTVLARRRLIQRRPVRIAVVGVGYWGPNLVRNLLELDEAAVTLICDTDPNALASARRRWPQLPTTLHYEQALRDPDVDAVALATPVATHAGMAAAALAAGKHVFVEKPLATSEQEATELLRLARRNGLVLMPGHTFLYSPAVTCVRELITSGELGDVYFVSTSRLNLGIHQADASVFWDLAPHDVAILRLWLDEVPSEVSAMSRSCVGAGVPDVAFVHLRFPSGTIAHLELGWLSPTKLRRSIVVGSRRMVMYDDTSRDPVRIYDSGVAPADPQSFGEFQLGYRTGDILVPAVPAVEPLSLELRDFCAAVRSGSEPQASAQLGLDVVRVVEAIERSAEGGDAVAVSPPLSAGASGAG